MFACFVFSLVRIRMRGLNIMSKNEFQHVRSGEPLQIPAAAYNAMLDAAQAHRNRRINHSPRGNGFDSLFVHIVNKTGRFLKRFEVVGLDGAAETRNVNEFRNRIIFRGVVPQKRHQGKFAVLQEDASPNMVVRACVYGVTQVMVKAEDEQLTYCDIEEGVTDHLVSGGNTEVLWSDETATIRWSLIRMGGGFKIHRGTLAEKCAEGASTVKVNPKSGEAITVAVPYPGDLKECPVGHPCRYYADADGWTLLDIACPVEEEEK
jgi:hypothetical protein